jgi:osmotically inducible lipoprotein OsmB
MANIIHSTTAHRIGIITLVILLPLVLADCGTAVGAGAGAYAGNRLTHGSAVGTIGGAVAGGVLGHVITGD